MCIRDRCPVEDVVHDGAVVDLLLGGPLGELVVLGPLVEVILPIFEELLLVGQPLEKAHADGLHTGVEADRLPLVGGELLVDLAALPFLQFGVLLPEDVPDVLVDRHEQGSPVVVLKGARIHAREVKSCNLHALIIL